MENKTLLPIASEMRGKILIVHQGALGDLVLTFPAMIALRKHFSEIRLICQDRLGKLACHLGLSDTHFPIESALFSSLYGQFPDPRMADIVRDCDVTVLFSFSPQLDLTIRGITDKPVCRIPPRPDAKEKIHVRDHVFSGLLGCGLLAADDLLPKMRDIRHEYRDAGKILLHPGSGSPRKNWRLSNFVKVYDLLEDQGKKPEFLLGPAEERFSKILRDNDGSEMRLREISDLTELVSLLKSAGGFVGNDSGATHLAAFSGVPTVAIFGPSDPDRWKPVGRAVKILRGRTSCEPCFETNPDNCDHPECSENTSPEEVIRLILSLTPPDK